MILTPNKKYLCVKCNKSYKFKQSLSSHKRYECGKPKQFQCLECKRRFKLPGHLRQHLKKIHKIFDFIHC